MKEHAVNEVVKKQNLLNLDREGLEHFFADSLGEQRYRAHQVMKWIHHRHVTDFDAMTDLGKGLRAKLQQHAEVLVPQVQFENPLPMARTSGCTAWMARIRSKRSSSPTRAEARSAYTTRSIVH